jgi:hypothetical protein
MRGPFCETAVCLVGCAGGMWAFQEPAADGLEARNLPVR